MTRWRRFVPSLIVAVYAVPAAASTPVAGSPATGTD